MSETLWHARPRAAPKMQMAPAGSCMVITLSPCQQHVSEMKAAAAAAAGCGLLQLVSGHSPAPDICLPVTVLEKEFTIQTLAAMAQRK